SCQIVPSSATAKTSLPALAHTASNAEPSSCGSQRNTVCSCGDAASTNTWKANVTTVAGTFHCHVFGADTCAVCRIWLYRKYGWLDPRNVPVPSAFATVTVPVPDATVGPEKKNTFTPLIVLPSAVPSGRAVRFCTVTSAWKIVVPAS